MTNIIGLVQDYKSNVPLEMLSNKYNVPIHTIIKVLYAVAVEKKDKQMKDLLLFIDWILAIRPDISVGEVGRIYNIMKGMI